MFVLAGVERGAEELLSYALDHQGNAPESSSSAPQTLVRLALARRLATNQFAFMKPLSRHESAKLESAADLARVYAALKEEKIIDPGAAWKDVVFAHPTPSTEHPDGYKGFVGIQEVVAPGRETLSLAEDALFKAAQGVTSVQEALRIVGE